MIIEKHASAGTLESSDVHIEVRPSSTTTIEIESAVAAQFEDAIMSTVRQMLKTFDVQGAHVILKDRGALDCTIRARLETALRRAGTQKEGR